MKTPDKIEFGNAQSFGHWPNNNVTMGSITCSTICSISQLWVFKCLQTTSLVTFSYHFFYFNQGFCMIYLTSHKDRTRKDVMVCMTSYVILVRPLRSFNPAAARSVWKTRRNTMYNTDGDAQKNVIGINNRYFRFQSPPAFLYSHSYPVFTLTAIQFSLIFTLTSIQ